MEPTHGCRGRDYCCYVRAGRGICCCTVAIEKSTVIGKEGNGYCCYSTIVGKESTIALEESATAVEQGNIALGENSTIIEEKEALLLWN